MACSAAAVPAAAAACVAVCLFPLHLHFLCIKKQLLVACFVFLSALPWLLLPLLLLLPVAVASLPLFYVDIHTCTQQAHCC
jgi:hypothetical protein